ncbi:MAG: endoglycosylceramidase [Actinomycetota bacterium]|jgi:endoglycosylceramidase
MPRRLLALAVATLLVVAGVSTAQARPARTPARHLLVQDGRIVDERGRTVLLRGVNVNQLGDYFQSNPAVPATLPFSRGDLEQIAALGLNSVRLLVHWSLLEPQPGVRDDAYLERVRQAVRWAGELGLYVVLDMHQDAWGKYIATDRAESCPAPLSHAPGWDGAPEWATLTDGLSRCRLSLREASPAVAQAWQSFWIDREGIQQHLVDTWAWLAGAFRSDPTVVGYDLVNEPNPGFTLGATDLTFLGEYHRRALEAIRVAENGGLTKIVFFEPVATWSATSAGVPRPWTTDDQIVFAPHIYTGSITADKAVTGQEVVPLRFGFEQAEREASVYGTTFWVGEWGPFSDAAGDGDYMTRFAALEDEFQVGSAFWQWKQACGDPHGVSYPDGGVPSESGNLVRVRCDDPAAPAGVVTGLVERNASVLSRPYLRAFPGAATFTSDPAMRSLVASGVAAPGSAPLEVWVPGATRPQVHTANLRRVDISAVPGGWLLRATPRGGPWTLSLNPS